VARGKELLTPDERLEYVRIKPNISEWELATYYTFTDHDMEVINRHRRDQNKLGFAVQLCTLRHPGWSLADIREIPSPVLSYIAKQVKVDPDVFLLYAQREPTRREHMEEIRQEYHYRNFSIHDYRSCSQHLFTCAQENTNTTFLINSAIDYLRKQKIILPAMQRTIERLVWESRNRAEHGMLFMLLTAYCIMKQT
jgi:TnpA family transposase